MQTTFCTVLTEQIKKEEAGMGGCKYLQTGMALGNFPEATVNLWDSLVAAMWHEEYLVEGPRVATCVLSLCLGFLPPTLVQNQMGCISF